MGEKKEKKEAARPIPEQLTLLLKAAKSKTLHHALLFWGPLPQPKKESLVLTFSRHLIGIRRRLTDSKFQELALKNRIPDFKMLLPDEHIAKENISVEQIEALTEEIATYPVESENRIIYIPDAALLTLSAQNAFLKKLEEPPHHTYFILCVSKPRLLLRTVVSRCLPVYFSEPPESDKIQFENYLHQISNLEEAKNLHKELTRAFSGSSEYGLALLKELQGILNRERFTSSLSEEERILILALAASWKYPRFTSKILELCQNRQKLSLDSLFYYTFVPDDKVFSGR